MALTAAEGFNQFISGLIPSDAERKKASSHRQAIYDKLNSEFGLYRMFESGSFKHGTGVSIHSDVDYFVSLKTNRPECGSTVLNSVREALSTRFPLTYIHVSRPAVVLEFGSGYEKVEIIPAYAKNSVNDSSMRFYIPGILNEWALSTPEAHLKYVNDCNNKEGIEGGAKSLARLVKAWKYYRNVPISSFYLEMRAASYMASQSSVSYPYDLSYFLNSLQRNKLAAMNDPTGNTGRIEPCSSDANLKDSLSKLDTAVSRAGRALEYYREGKVAEAFELWDMLFAYKFPAYY